jgi:ABC-type multidrug transport system ATPase subunit
MKGVVSINGKAFTKNMRKQIAYVLQEDIFYTELTVKQQLTITSHLRLPEAVTHEEKAAAVDHVIKTLRIKKCQDTKILLISGGEKKRCNIGTELLTNPSILLLDEPTSGLDSTAAHALINTMRFMADEKMTLISSIHQPSSKVFYKFDKLILLADGHIAYCGPPAKCLAYLATLNFSPPSDYNPADFVMDLVNSDDELTRADGDGEGEGDQESTQEDTAKSIRKLLTDKWDNSATLAEANSIVATSTGDEEVDEEGEDGYEEFKYPSGYWTQFSILFKRALIISKGSITKTTQLVQTLLISCKAAAC